MLDGNNNVLHHLTHDFKRAFEIEAFWRVPVDCKAMAFSVSRRRTDKSVPLGRPADQTVDITICFFNTTIVQVISSWQA